MGAEDVDLPLGAGDGVGDASSPLGSGGSGAAEAERPGRWAKNQTALADHLEVDRKTIRRWLDEKDPDCPGKTADGRYDIQLWKEWVAAKGKRAGVVTKGKGKIELEVDRLRLQNEKLEIENMLRRGELMHSDEVCKVLTEMMGAFVGKIRGMKHTLAPACVGVTIPEATKRIDLETDEALEELALGDWAKKKPFWSSVYAHLQDLRRKSSLGAGPSNTSETP